MNADITVVMATIPPRQALRDRAFRSIAAQTLTPAAVSVALDTDHQGAGYTRGVGLAEVKTGLVAFLDDDDEFEPTHLEQALRCMEETGADYVYPWYTVIGGTDPRPHLFGKPFDPANPVQTTVVTLVKTELAKEVGFPVESVEALTHPDRLYCGEDWEFTKGCVAAGAKIVHHPAKTWLWYHHGFGRPGLPGNTSGLPHRWA